MSGKTKIEWATDQWNPVTGCTKVSQGCKQCYAERMWPRLASPRYQPNIYTGRAFTDVKCHPEKLDIPLRWTKPRRVFVNSMSDLFHESVPDSFIIDVFNIMYEAKQHTFQVLTKRPERMRDFLIGTSGCGMGGELMPNVWFGVSVEDQATADERIPILLQIPAAVRWISAEPLLGQIDLIEAMGMCEPGARYNGWVDLHWVVAGGESGPKARPMHPDWARSLRDQCEAAGVAYFFKQWGEWVPMMGHVQGAPVRGAKFVHADGIIMGRARKKAAGRMLDGRTWDEYPK